MDVDAPQDTTAESHPVTAGVTPVGGAGSTKDQHRHKLVKESVQWLRLHNVESEHPNVGWYRCVHKYNTY